MMRYYKELDENGRVVVVGQGLGHIEITEEEYNTLRNEMHEKSDLADKLYWGKITIDSVPAEWREEVQHIVDVRISEMGTADEQELSAGEALEIILGGVG